MKQQLLIDGCDPTARHADDWYPTPGFQTRALLRRLKNLNGLRLFEPAAGDGAIVQQLVTAYPGAAIFSNDIVVREPLLPDFLLDARQPESWSAFRAPGEIDVVISNLPFNEAIAIARQAVAHTRQLVALLLRLSWLEPTEEPDYERGPWLAEHPPTHLIVLPRYSYRQNGSTDSVTSSWLIWDKTGLVAMRRPIDIVTQREKREMEALQ